MALKEPILKLLRKKYDPLSLVELTFQRYDLMFKTDEEGRPILLFMGKKDANGNIRGERYARRLKFDKEGRLIKDHWDQKGKATP
ncbi:MULTISPECIES: hypothetical protein [Olivibacter]|jgi:hypothetical protein|uniref:Uncharacterized protein n=3 Tax=Sphingobacteriaceae TaxID=84566 RepID=F4CCC0_SPHS2|nr:MULTISPECIES: hypothetical protein [Olivibacter]MCL4640075.1 hypothetical protein [Olivibacter sp. UJ_SKK_5.1]MDM8176458.1 hypothetical protein [Olivibacter sp. 47]MDX3916088.1 hypothetical protein [Pseudosphingobacterium sp.]QEL00723.1 hypothetical protein FKG96_07835 [Olivibacter sp. LS-1]